MFENFIDYIGRIVAVIVVPYLVLTNFPDNFPFKNNATARIWILFDMLSLHFGVKLFFIVYHWHEIQRFMTSDGNPLKFFLNCGHGSIGIFLAGMIFLFFPAKLRKEKVSYFVLSDYALPYYVLIVGLVRIDCFTAGCCHGVATGSSWGCISPFSGDMLPRQPTQLYELIYCAIIFFVARMLYKKNMYSGFVTFFCIFMYGFFRFFNEFLRVDSPIILMNLKVSQIAMILFIFTGTLGMIISSKFEKKIKYKKT